MLHRRAEQNVDEAGAVPVHSRWLVSFLFAVGIHALLLLALWGMTEAVRPPIPLVDRTPRLAFTVDVAQSPLTEAPSTPRPGLVDKPAVPARPSEPEVSDSKTTTPEERPASVLRKATNPVLEPEKTSGVPLTKNEVAVRPDVVESLPDASAQPESSASVGTIVDGRAVEDFSASMSAPTDEDSFMSRVVQGAGPRLSDAAKATLKKAPVGETAKERGERRVRKWASVDWRPRKDITNGRRKLKKTARGGYRYVDADTGELQQKNRQKPVGDSLPPMSAEQGGRYDPSSFAGEWARRPVEREEEDDLVPNEEGGFDYQGKGFAARILPDGQVRFAENLLSFEFGKTSNLSEDLSFGYGRDLTSGTFDVTDALMRLAGRDPYVSAKMRFMEDTWDIRIDLKKNFKLAHIEQTLIYLRRQLDKILKAKPGPASHAALFEIWDECAEGADGKAAREFIVFFIRAYLPQSGIAGFKDDELRELNANRRSDERFSPYESLK